MMCLFCQFAEASWGFRSSYFWFLQVGQVGASPFNLNWPCSDPTRIRKQQRWAQETVAVTFQYNKFNLFLLHPLFLLSSELLLLFMSVLLTDICAALVLYFLYNLFWLFFNQDFVFGIMLTKKYPSFVPLKYIH